MLADDDVWKGKLGARAKRLRAQSGQTLKTLAEQSGLSVRFLSQVEAGKANPSLGSLRELAKGLNVEVGALLFDLPSAAHHAVMERLPTLSVAACKSALAHTPEAQNRPIALLGLRGAGKSTVGQALASATGRAFIEVDRLVEEEAGLSLGALFEMHGESHYRVLEHQVLAAKLEDKSAILATGGGVVTHPESVALLREHAITVWLRADAQAHWDRVREQGDFRPMHNRARARAELETLYAARAPLYAAANHIVDTDARSVEEVVAYICQGLALDVTPDFVPGA